MARQTLVWTSFNPAFFVFLNTARMTCRPMTWGCGLNIGWVGCIICISDRACHYPAQCHGCASDRGANQNRSDLRSRADQENPHQVDEMTTTCRLKASSFFLQVDSTMTGGGMRCRTRHTAMLFVSGNRYRSTDHHAR